MQYFLTVCDELLVVALLLWCRQAIPWKAVAQQSSHQEEPVCSWQLCQAAYPEDESLLVTYYYNSGTGISQYEMPEEYGVWVAAHDRWLQQQQ